MSSVRTVNQKYSLAVGHGRVTVHQSAVGNRQPFDISFVGYLQFKRPRRAFLDAAKSFDDRRLSAILNSLPTSVRSRVAPLITAVAGDMARPLG